MNTGLTGLQSPAFNTHLDVEELNFPLPSRMGSRSPDSEDSDTGARRPQVGKVSEKYLRTIRAHFLYAVSSLSPFLIYSLCVVLHRLRLASLWHACPKWHARRFSWHAEFTAVPTLFPINLTILQRICTYVCMYVYILCTCICMYVCVYVCFLFWRRRDLYDYDYYQILLKVNHCYKQTKSGEKLLLAQTGFLTMFATLLFSICNNFYTSNNIIIITCII
jgi:hypothetical protein